MGLIEDIGSGGLGIAVILIVVVFVGAVAILATWLILKWRRYNQFVCEIWQKDGFGQFVAKYDKAGIFIDDKTKNKRLFLKNNNVGLDPDNIPYLTTNKGIKKILLLQTGLKNFKYIRPVINNEIMHFTVGEEDVNWAVNSYERQKRLFTQGWVAQYLPFILLAFVSIIILILFINLFKQVPMMLEMVKTMKDVAVAMQQANSGTTVIQ